MVFRLWGVNAGIIGGFPKFKNSHCVISKLRQLETDFPILLIEVCV